MNYNQFHPTLWLNILFSQWGLKTEMIKFVIWIKIDIVMGERVFCRKTLPIQDHKDALPWLLFNFTVVVFRLETVIHSHITHVIRQSQCFPPPSPTSECPLIPFICYKESSLPLNQYNNPIRNQLTHMSGFLYKLLFSFDLYSSPYTNLKLS